MATIQVKHVPDHVHRTLRTRAAACGQSMQQYLLEMLNKQAAVATVEEIIAHRRAEMLVHGDTGVATDSIVEVIREDRDSR